MRYSKRNSMVFGRFVYVCCWNILNQYDVLYVPCPILFILCVYNFVSVVSTVYLNSSLLHKQTTELLKRGHNSSHLA